MDSTAPLLDLELAGQFFSVGPSSDEAAELRSIYGEFVRDAASRLEKLARMATEPGHDAAAARRELHQLRGVVANFGLQRAADAMRELELSWAAPAAASQRDALARATADVHAGLAALCRSFPYLAA